MEENNMSIEGGASESPKRGGGGMKRATGLLIAAIVVIVLILALASRSQAPQEGATTGDNAEESMTAEKNGGEEIVGEEAIIEEQESESQAVTYSDSGYSPSNLTVKKGGIVTFVNQSSRQTWPASAMHPTHTAYPGSGIEKCGTAEAAGIFDACRGLGAGESWSFQFNEVGDWKYHDHLNLNYFGSITVAE